MNRIVPALYWTAVGLLLIGGLLAIVGANADLDQLRLPMEIVTGLAWPVAATGAVLDILRHRDHRPATEPETRRDRRLRSEA